MKINIKHWYNKFDSCIDIKYLFLLVLSTLHYDKKITDVKLTGQFKALRAGTLQRYKRTYHCEIIDEWYNDESAYDIFKDVIELKGLITIPFINFIGYLVSFENKNYNYCINIFGSEFLYPLFERWDPQYHDLDFCEFTKFHMYGVDEDWFDTPQIRASKSSYECFECGSHHTTYYKNETENLKKINEWLHNQKKGDLKKIPFHDISNKVFNKSFSF